MLGLMMDRNAPWALVLTGLAACASADRPVDPHLHDEAQAVELQEAERLPARGDLAPSKKLSDWGTERIVMPPAFAPELPAGVEVLLFAPGMFDPGAEDYWSYVFRMRIGEPDLSVGRLHEILELYYDGLMASVAADRGLDVGEDPASVILLSQPPDEYFASIETVDAFVTGEELVLNAVLRLVPEVGGTQIEFMASPQPRAHEIWDDLEDALASLTL